MCTHVTRHTEPSGVISHVTRDAGSAAVASSKCALKVITSRLGGSTSTISPATATRALIEYEYGAPTSHDDSTRVPKK